MKFLIFSIMLLPIFCEAKETCQSDGKFRFHKGGKEVIESASYCFDNSNFKLESKNCLKNNCIAISKTKQKVPMEKISGEFGSPGFKLCFVYGGQPQLLEVLDGKNWVKMDRCFFSADKSFIDIPRLLDLMRSNKQ